MVSGAEVPPGKTAIRSVKYASMYNTQLSKWESLKVGANTWSIMLQFFKLLWIVNIHQMAKDCSCRLYRVNAQRVAQILSQNRGKK